VSTASSRYNTSFLIAQSFLPCLAIPCRMSPPALLPYTPLLPYIAFLQTNRDPAPPAYVGQQQHTVTATARRHRPRPVCGKSRAVRPADALPAGSVLHRRMRRHSLGAIR
jgi:hypothetical protein